MEEKETTIKKVLIIFL